MRCRAIINCRQFNFLLCLSLLNYALFYAKCTRKTVRVEVRITLELAFRSSPLVLCKGLIRSHVELAIYFLLEWKLLFQANTTCTGHASEIWLSQNENFTFICRSQCLQITIIFLIIFIFYFLLTSNA
ncbi:hypothetical protein FGO68_gene15640 [Halteria grandinella]|uniref:Secreted protein n=1 Tax=Halteria grandinella TaxID=5974 RepID=A0A8J8T7T5_HALGN|nr:hypothetical protein FGO68_gene15640 [Halteria grandinella]